MTPSGFSCPRLIDVLDRLAAVGLLTRDPGDGWVSPRQFPAEALLGEDFLRREINEALDDVAVICSTLAARAPDAGRLRVQSSYLLPIAYLRPIPHLVLAAAEGFDSGDSLSSSQIAGYARGLEVRGFKDLALQVRREALERHGRATSGPSDEAGVEGGEARVPSGPPPGDPVADAGRALARGDFAAVARIAGAASSDSKVGPPLR